MIDAVIRAGPAVVGGVVGCAGFFDFMVGVMPVALSDSWQRVGDMAARTVAVDVRRVAPGLSLTVIFPSEGTEHGR